MSCCARACVGRAEVHRSRTRPSTVTASFAPHTPPRRLPRRALLCSSTLAGAAALLARVPAGEAGEVAYDAFAADYDDLNGGASARLLGLEELRAKLLANARGDVLEVGVGTGLNLPLYIPSQLSSLRAIDLSEGMLAEARARGQQLPVGALLSLRQADVERLPFDDDSFDCVIDTFSLCVYPDPVQALRSMRRVVRPDGRVWLLEHNRSPNALLGAYQDLTAAPVAAMSKGCVYNQDVQALVQAAGLRVLRSTPALGGLIQAVEAVKA